MRLVMIHGKSSPEFYLDQAGKPYIDMLLVIDQDVEGLHENQITYLDGRACRVHRPYIKDLPENLRQAIAEINTMALPREAS